MNQNERILRQRAIEKAHAIRDAKLALQSEQYNFFIPLTGVTVLADSVNTPASVQIGSDGDFAIKKITGDFVPNASSLCTISVKISDQGRGNNLTEGYVPLNLFLSPGSSTNALFFAWDFNYILRATSTLQLDFLNTDTSNRAVNLLFFGEKILR